MTDPNESLITKDAALSRADLLSLIDSEFAKLGLGPDSERLNSYTASDLRELVNRYTSMSLKAAVYALIRQKETPEEFNALVATYSAMPRDELLDLIVKKHYGNKTQWMTSSPESLRALAATGIQNDPYAAWRAAALGLANQIEAHGWGGNPNPDSTPSNTTSPPASDSSPYDNENFTTQNEEYKGALDDFMKYSLDYLRAVMETYFDKSLANQYLKTTSDQLKSLALDPSTPKKDSWDPQYSFAPARALLMAYAIKTSAGATTLPVSTGPSGSTPPQFSAPVSSGLQDSSSPILQGVPDVFSNWDRPQWVDEENHYTQFKYRGDEVYRNAGNDLDLLNTNLYG